MILYVCTLLYLTGVTLGQQPQQVNCPREDDILRCAWTHVKDLSDRLTTPIHNVFDSNTYFITPTSWNRYETEEVCKVKENYKQFLMCALNLRATCMRDEYRTLVMSQWKINRVVDIWCDHFKCDDCTKILCDRCGPTRVFDYTCTSPKVVDVKTCLGRYETGVFDNAIAQQRQAAHPEGRPYTFVNYTCELINLYRDCTISAFAPCGQYTRNLTGWFTLEALPEVCAGSVIGLSAILTLAVAILFCARVADL